MRFFLWILLLCCSQLSLAQNGRVLHLSIKGEINAQSTELLKLALKNAESEDFKAILLEIDTYGGFSEEADNMRKLLLAFSKDSYAWINKNAGSAGALISIACTKIYMCEGASMGAATPVYSNGEYAPEKYQSFIRSIMRSTAEARKRDPRIAEGMVDLQIEIDSIKKTGQILSLTSSEALSLGYCNGIANSLEELSQLTACQTTDFQAFELSWLHKVSKFFMNPFISAVLIIVIVGGIFMEFHAPGTALPILASLSAAAMYFVPYYIHGLAENWELLLFLLGVILLAIELFVTPGFGVLGFAGLFLIFAGLVLMMLGNQYLSFENVDKNAMIISLSSVFFAIVATFIFSVLMASKIANSKAFSKVSLQTSQSKEDGYVSGKYGESYIGLEGSSASDLRPSGKILLEDNILDAVSLDGFIEKGKKVKVVSAEGNILKVKSIS